MNPQDYILNLVREALAEIDLPSSRLGSTVRKAIRIARMRNDHLNLWWLELELVTHDNATARKRVLGDILPHMTKEQYDFHGQRQALEYCEERGLPTAEGEDPKVCALGVEEIETQVEHFERIHANANPPGGMTPFDTAAFHDSSSRLRNQASLLIANLKAVLARIRERVAHYLSAAETQLVYGQTNADVFEQNRQYVDSKLTDMCPEALSIFRAAVERVKQGDDEARAHALTSCRRVLKSLADRLYPPVTTPVLGPDGKKRDLGDDKFVSRLWQFVADRCHGSRSGDVLLTTLQDLGGRIDAIYCLTNKGVHAQVSAFEMNQCVIQTYLLVGDILRVADRTSAIEREDKDEVANNGLNPTVAPRERGSPSG